MDQKSLVLVKSAVKGTKTKGPKEIIEYTETVVDNAEEVTAQALKDMAANGVKMGKERELVLIIMIMEILVIKDILLII